MQGPFGDPAKTLNTARRSAASDANIVLHYEILELEAAVNFKSALLQFQQLTVN